MNTAIWVSSYSEWEKGSFPGQPAKRRPARPGREIQLFGFTHALIIQRCVQPTHCDLFCHRTATSRLMLASGIWYTLERAGDRRLRSEEARYEFRSGSSPSVSSPCWYSSLLLFRPLKQACKKTLLESSRAPRKSSTTVPLRTFSSVWEGIPLTRVRTVVRIHGGPPIRDRLAVGRLALDQQAGVRILVPEPEASWPRPGCLNQWLARRKH